MRDGDRRPRRFTVVSWPNRPPKQTDQAERTPTRDRVAAGALVVAGTIIAGVIVGGAVVVYRAQYAFALDHNGGNRMAAAIQAGIPEAVWIAMAALGLSQALRGRSSLRATLSIALFFALSLGAQLLHAEQTREGYLVAAITPIALALMLEALLHGVRHWALARDGQDTQTTPVLVRILRGVLVVLVMPGAWLLRLVLDKETTTAGMREWLLDVIPYAPGRTRAQDRAREAQLEAGGAQELAEQVRREMETAVSDLKERHARELDEREKAEKERAAELTEELEGLRSASGDLDGQLRQLRRELARERAAREDSEKQYARELAARERHEADAQRAAAEVSRLATELEAARASLPARQQVELLYAELSREGERRYGSYEHLDQMAEEIYSRLDGAVESRTVRRYLREYLSAAETVTAIGHDGVTSEARVNSAPGSTMIGGA